MRAEKEFLVNEVGSYLDASSYALLIEYTGFTVAEVAELRGKIKPAGAQFHVIKGSMLGKAVQSRNLPDVTPILGGQVALISGGDDIATIYKTVEAFFKDKSKGDMKGALLYGELVDKSRIGELSTLPTMDEARAKLLALLNTPATMFVRLIGTPGQQLVNVLDAIVNKDKAA